MYKVVVAFLRKIDLTFFKSGLFLAVDRHNLFALLDRGAAMAAGLCLPGDGEWMGVYPGGAWGGRDCAGNGRLSIHPGGHGQSGEKFGGNDKIRTHGKIKATKL